ncbi:MAG TPA: tryptophan synthase subunit alpha [Actinomycetes bacterium]|nr:tryptophan synthase subunit alpha [Actinomycetes bacterium]
MTAQASAPTRSLNELFSSTRASGRAALIGYLPAGYPTVEGAVDAMRAMVEAGVDVVEVGLPYSDPLLDGPVIQAVVEQALAQGVTTTDVLRTVREVAKSGAPTLVMSYWNPIERYGVERFARDLADAGGAGVITADITPEEAGEWLTASDAHDLSRVFLVAPSSTEERVNLTVSHTSGFVYAAAVMGVTGAREQVAPTAEALVRRTKAVTSLPVCVGLGVSTGDQAAQIAEFADGVIVGSAFVRALMEAPTLEAGVTAVRDLATELRSGIERARRTPTIAE